MELLKTVSINILGYRSISSFSAFAGASISTCTHFVLTFCTILAFSGSRNVALGKSTTQCSTCCAGFSGHAVDGNRNSNYHKHSCTHTSHTFSPWWRVDLGKEVNVLLIHKVIKVVCNVGSVEIRIEILKCWYPVVIWNLSLTFGAKSLSYGLKRFTFWGRVSSLETLDLKFHFSLVLFTICSLSDYYTSILDRSFLYE